jgi:DNA-binding NarL/FixJ family response regulator
MLGGLHGLLANSFDALVMVSDERSLNEAVEKIHPNLIVVDLSLTESGEANIVKRLHSVHPDIPLIVLSVHDEPSVAANVRESGAAGFVVKRRVGTDLLSVVQEVLKERVSNPE